MNHLPHLGDGLFRWVAQTTWQAAVLAILILLAQGLLRKRLSPEWRYGLWLLLVARLLMPSIPPSAFSIFNLAPPAARQPDGAYRTTMGADPNFVVNSFNSTPRMRPLPHEAEGHVLEAPAAVAIKPNPVWKIGWPNVLFWGWLAGVCFFSARLVWTNTRFRSRLNHYQPVADENVTRLFNDCRAAFNITDPVRLIESDEVESPAVYGLWRKWLLLPDGVFERFSGEELRHIFLHELAHIRRGDLVVNWLVSLLQALHWFNPVLWLAWARMRADREVATDALALAHVRESDHVPYGETILKVLEGLTGARALPGTVGIVESKAQLKERLVAISRPGKSWKWAALAAFVLIAGLGLTRAQTEKTARDQSSAWTVSGHVLDSETKAPVANFSVTPVQTNDLNGSALSLQHNVDGHNGSYQIDISNRIAQQLRVEAKGYLPESKLLVPDATDVDFLLSKDGSSGTVVMPEISGRIVDQRGEPVSGVQVAVVNSNLTVDLGIGKSRLFNRQFPHIYGEPRLANLPWNYCTTDARGRFYLDDLDGAFHLIAANEKGFAEIPTNQFSANMTITLEPWGRIEGTLRNYDEVGSNDVVFLGYTFNTFYDQFRKIDPEYAEKLPHLWYPDRPNTIRSTYETGTDEHGHYSFDFVRPGQYEVFGSDVRERAMINANDATVKNIGGQGRPLIGIFKIRNPYVNIAWDRVGSRLGGDGFCYFCSVPHMPATPFKSRQDYLAWRERRDVDRTLDKNGHGHRVRIAKDGSFRIDQVESGQYEMELFLRDPKHRVNWDFPVAETNLLAEYDGFDRTFDIPSSEPNNREPLDLGVIEISLKAQETPDAAAQTNRLSPAGNISPPESTMLRGTVVLPDGTPAANAEVGLKIAGQSLKVADRELVAESGSQAVTRTVAQGAFTLPMRDMATALCAVHDAGFAKLSRKELTNGVKIMLQPWGRVEGVLRLNQHPAASETVELNNYVADSWDFTSRIRTDAEGRFVFDHVPAGDCQLLRCVPFGNGWRTCCPIHFQVRPGETTNLSWGGNGRPVVGKCVVENVDNLPHNLRLKVSIHTPDQLTSPPPELTNPRQMVEWTHSEAGQKARNESRFFGATAKSDGSFQVDDVSPGEYELSFEFEDVPLPNSISGTVRMLSSQPQRIVIPPLSNPENCEPFDLGTVVPSFREALLFTAVRDGLKAGQTAPPLETKTLSGQPLRLTDYRGKYVLVDLEDTFPGSETEAIQAVNETFSQDDRLVIITLSEKEDESFVKYLSGKRYTRWVLGDMGFERYAQPYQMASGQLPMILLIDPQGNIVATRLRGQAIQSAVAKALARK